MPDDAGSSFTVSDKPAESLDDAVQRLAALDPLAYDQVRVSEAKGLKVRPSSLDKAVGKIRSEIAAASSDTRTVVLRDHGPWGEAVSTEAILTELSAAVRRHLILSQEAADAIALWVAYTWVYDRFDHTPRLAITSPTKRCGKSTLLDVLRAICRRTLKADNISASGVFRTIESLAPLTLLIDEADSFLGDNDELRGVLNSGFERSGVVIRVEEIQREHVAVQFATFAPCALAAIGSVPGTIGDRSVPIRLERKAAGEAVAKLRDGGNRGQLATLAAKLARWAADFGEALSLSPPIPEAMGDREGDICAPLLAIADHAGEAWAGRARRGLLAQFRHAAEAEASTEASVLLLTDIRSIFMEKDATALPSAELCLELGNLETRPWPEWKNGKPTTPTQVSRVLRAFKIKPTTYRPPGGEPVKGYHRDQFEEAWERYLPAHATQGGFEPLHGNSADQNSELTVFRPVTPGVVLPLENQEDRSQEQQCYRVTAQMPPVSGDAAVEGYL